MTDLLWLDPGLTTGWALLEYVGQLCETFTCGQVRGTVEAGDLIQSIMLRCAGLHIGWEAYLIGKGSRVTGDPIPSLEVIGTARWLAHEHRAVLLPAVPASHRMIATPDAIRQLGWKTHGPHSVDATRHLLAYCIRERILADRIRTLYSGILGRYDESTTDATTAKDATP